jgi:leucyl/phenylalanyl-tRNA---protein transferase
MADDDGSVNFYTIDPRGVLELDALHIPRTLQRTVRRGLYQIRFNHAFAEVVRGCADRDSTWISPAIVDVYTRLRELGIAHSVEAYQGDRLCGGLYGLALGGAFVGESMFARAPDASKVCVVALVERLRERGFVLLDCQDKTAHMERFGAVHIPLATYLERLHAALPLQRRFS